MPDTPEKPAVYPGRDELNLAQAHFRRSCARLFREAHRHDVDLLPQLAAIVTEATGHLNRLASAAIAAESNSSHNRELLAKQEEKLRRSLRLGARKGDPRALRLLAQLDARAGRESS